MIDLIASIFQYTGAIITTAMACLSLFFKFTEESTNNSYNLTKPGKFALALIIIGAVMTIGATVTKDILDNRAKADAELKYQTLLSEARLMSTTFETVEIKLVFDGMLGWRDGDFLTANSAETICGNWVHLNIGGGQYADWCLSKKKEAIDQYDKKHNEILYVETRAEQIDEFIRQNYPDIRRHEPRELVFKSSPDELANYKSPDVIYFSYDYKGFAEGVNFDVPDPSAQLKYGNEKYDQMRFMISSKITFAQILGSRIELTFGVTTSNVNGAGWDVSPKDMPMLLRHLVTIDVYLDGKLIKRVFDNQKDTIKLKPNSEWALKHHEFSANLFELSLDHDLVLKSYK